MIRTFYAAVSVTNLRETVAKTDPNSGPCELCAVKPDLPVVTIRHLHFQAAFLSQPCCSPHPPCLHLVYSIITNTLKKSERVAANNHDDFRRAMVLFKWIASVTDEK